MYVTNWNAIAADHPAIPEVVANSFTCRHLQGASAFPCWPQPIVYNFYRLCTLISMLECTLLGLVCCACHDVASYKE